MLQSPGNDGGGRVGPLATADIAHGGGVIILVLDLFKHTEEIADFFFSGAAPDQAP